MKLLIFFLLGLLTGILLTGCMPKPVVQVVPVLTVPAACPAFQDLPYSLDSTVPDDQLICVSTWRDDPLNPMVCLRVGELKALIAGIRKS